MTTSVSEVLRSDIKAADLKVKIFADGADRESMLESYANPLVSGFTTNPTLMRRAGVSDYVGFAKEILKEIPDRDISFEVFSDEFDDMERQAREIATWGENVYVKIPVTNTQGETSYDLVNRLSHEGVKVNVTAIFTLDQVRKVAEAVDGGAPCCVSVFAGRIADAGIDYMPTMIESVNILKPNPKAELIWASPREVFNVVEANDMGCHIITCTSDIIKKLPTFGKDLAQFSLETVQLFYKDATAAGYSI
ncbi:MAG: transaldolase [Candidatus Latescibacterota bacterium]|jgi:transaldolase